MKKLLITAAGAFGIYALVKAYQKGKILSRAGSEIKVNPTIDWSKVNLNSNDLLNLSVDMGTKLEIVNPNPVSAEIGINRAEVVNANNDTLAYNLPSAQKYVVQPNNITHIPGPTFRIPAKTFYGGITMSNLKKLLSKDRKELIPRGLKLKLRIDVEGVEIDIVKPLVSE